MFGLSGSHLLILALVALVFGSRRLPEFGSNLGKGMKAFKTALEGQSHDTGPALEDRRNPPPQA